jgi:hypothetical protein
MTKQEPGEHRELRALQAEYLARFRERQVPFRYDLERRVDPRLCRFVLASPLGRPVLDKDGSARREPGGKIRFRR